MALHPSFCTTDEPDSPHRQVPSITGSIYVGFGADDKAQAPADNVPFIEAVRQLDGGRGEVEIHEGADHGFAVPGSPAYHEAAASRSYERARALFRQALA